MKKILLSLGLLIGCLNVNAQENLTLEQCYEMAIKNSTIGAQREIQGAITQSNIKAVNAGYLPKLDLNAQVNYQSDVVQFPELPFSIPGFEPLKKDQYKAVVELQQVIYDGGYMARQKRILKSNLNIENQKLEVATLQLKDRVAALLLGVLLVDENTKIVKVAISELDKNVANIKNLLANGVAMQSNVDLLEAESLKAQQQLIELNSTRASLISMMSILIGKDLNTKQQFVTPEVNVDNNTQITQRPELKLFDAQQETLELQNRLIASKNIPKAVLFGNAGNGRPGMNFLSNKFEWFYYVGAKLTVPLTGWTATKHEKQSVRLQRSLVDQQRIDFLRANKIEITEQLAEVEKYKKLIETDSTIIAKRDAIRVAEQQRLLNGVATSNDYVTELNNEKQARLAMQLHKIKLIQAVINYKSLIGIN